MADFSNPWSPQNATPNVDWLMALQARGLPDNPTSQGGVPPQAPLPTPKTAQLKPILNKNSVQNIAGVTASDPRAKIESDITANQNQKTGTVRNLTYSPEEFSALAQAARSLPEVQDQNKSLQNLQDLVSMTALQKPTNEGWVKPLLALSDSETGSKTLSGYQPGITPEERNQLLLKYGDEIQKRKMDMSKALLEGISKQRAGTQQDLLTQMMIEKMGMGTEPLKPNAGLAEVRRNQMVANSGKTFDTDPVLKPMQLTLNNLGRAESMMNGNTPITGKNFALLQQDLINAMAPGGAATEGKVNREMVQTLASKLNDISQYFGDVQDLRKEQPQVFSQLQGLIQQVKADYSKAGLQRVGELKANFNGIPDPILQNMLQNKTQMLTKKFNDNMGPSIQTGAQAPGAKIKVISPDGRTGSIPAANLDKALSKGYKKAE